MAEDLGWWVMLEERMESEWGGDAGVERTQVGATERSARSDSLER